MNEVEHRSRRRTLLLLFLVAGAAAIPLAFGLLHPFVTMADNNTAEYAQPARNLLRHGPIATRLGLVTDVGENAPARFAFYTHHPPLMAIVAAGAFMLFGVSEGAARVYPAVCSLGSALAVFLIWRRCRGDLPGAVAAIVMTTLPGFGHFGKMLGAEAPTLFFSLIALLVYRAGADRGMAGDRRGSVALLLVYAASCLSGWAGFYIGPLLMLDASTKGSSASGSRRRTMIGIGLTGLAVFALLATQVVIMTGSLDTLIGAARYRFTGAAPGLVSIGENQSWMRHVAAYLPRLFSVEAGPAVIVGVLAAGVALARRRASREGAMTVTILALLGLAHPLLFHGAAFYHDWLLFHLLPVVAIAAAEGILLVAGAAGALAAAARAPARAAGAVGAVLLLLALSHRIIICGRDLSWLADEQPQYTGKVLGEEIARRTPSRSSIMANFLMLDCRLRFYADRLAVLTTDRERFDRLARDGGYALYVRNLDIPLEPGLEAKLEEHPSLRLGAFRLYDLQGATIFSDPEPRTSAFGPLDGRFGDKVALTGYEVTLPVDPPEPLPWWRVFLGGPVDPNERPRIIEVSSTWSQIDPELPDWTLFEALDYDQRPGKSLPLLRLPELRHPVLSRWQGYGSFHIESAFLFPPGYPRGEYALRFGVSDHGRSVPLVVPGPPRPWLKVMNAGRVKLFE